MIQYYDNLTRIIDRDIRDHVRLLRSEEILASRETLEEYCVTRCKELRSLETQRNVDLEDIRLAFMDRVNKRNAACESNIEGARTDLRDQEAGGSHGSKHTGPQVVDLDLQAGLEKKVLRKHNGPSHALH